MKLLQRKQGNAHMKVIVIDDDSDDENELSHDTLRETPSNVTKDAIKGKCNQVFVFSWIKYKSCEL